MKKWTILVSTIMIFLVSTFINVSAVPKEFCIRKEGENYKVDKLNEIEKTVVLTFDDGPSNNNTNSILDILERNNVKASFFVIGRSLKENESIANRMMALDMDILPHTNCHEYNKIYSSEENYFKDLEECVSCINNVTGEKNNPLYVRMPGGSDNKVCNEAVLNKIKTELKNDHIYYVDWNVDSTDALNNKRNRNDILNSVKTYGGRYLIEVLLMHDTCVKKETVASLQEIISFYKERGYKFKKINDLDDKDLNYLIKNKVIYR